MVGKASLEITAQNNDVQISDFGDNSFKITNLGDRNIALITIDVTNALYPDSVFDPFGLAGDSTAKKLTIDSNGGTGVILPNAASYIGAGGKAGYKGLQLKFNNMVDSGFEPGESIGFSVDMDPNSIAGSEKGLLDGGSIPSWDVGGVSGAELIGSSFTVTFTDGTTATGQLQGNNNQGGSQALATQNSPKLKVSLTVNGLGQGSIGTYGSNVPSIIVNGQAGQTARIVLTKGFIQPIVPYATFLKNQLDVLAKTNFPANNAVEFQTVDVRLTGKNQDISQNFDFTKVEKYDFAGEDRLPVGLVASIIDVDDRDFALGEVTDPIYLKFDAASGGGTIDPKQPTEIKVNFGISLSESILGFVQDVGAAYSAKRGYGWITQASAGSDQPIPLDLIANGRNRHSASDDPQGSSIEPELDSLMHMQYPEKYAKYSNSIFTPAAWEYDLANGVYEVKVGVGDPSYFDSVHVINIEGKNIISGFIPHGIEQQDFSVGSGIVEVNDGRLTVDAIGGENTKINYISIIPVNIL